MKKIILSLFFIINSFSFATDLLTFTYSDSNGGTTHSVCIEDYYSKNARLHFFTSAGQYWTFIDIHTTKFDIKNAYVYIDSQCKKADSLTSDYTLDITKSLNYDNTSALGLSEYDFNTLMALSGLLLGSFLVYGVIRNI